MENLTLPSRYIAEYTRVHCPYPMLPLDLWFTLYWLDGAAAHNLRAVQRECRENPETEVVWEGEEEFDCRKPCEAYARGFQRESQLRYGYGLVDPPLAGTALALRRMQILEASANRLFEEHILREFYLRGIPIPPKDRHVRMFGSKGRPMFNVYAVWAKYVEPVEGFDHSNGGAEIALYAVTGKIMSDPLYWCEEAAVMIAEAIAINFKGQI